MGLSTSRLHTPNTGYPLSSLVHRDWCLLAVSQSPSPSFCIQLSNTGTSGLLHRPALTHIETAGETAAETSAEMAARTLSGRRMVNMMWNDLFNISPIFRCDMTRWLSYLSLCPSCSTLVWYPPLEANHLVLEETPKARFPSRIVPYLFIVATWWVV